MQFTAVQEQPEIPNNKMFCLPQPCPLSTENSRQALSTDSSSDNDESKAVLTSPQGGWDKDTGRVGGQESPPYTHRNNKRLGREQEERNHHSNCNCSCVRKDMLWTI